MTLNAEINSDINSKELDALWEEDPTEAAKVDRKIRKRRDTISQAQKRIRDHQTQQFQEVLKEEQKKVALKYPDLSDPVKGNNLRTNMTNYLLTKGFNDKEVNVPQPADMVAPVNENPKTVEPPADTVNPAEAASPPEAPLTVVPSTTNWKPAISVFTLYQTSPPSKEIVF